MLHLPALAHARIVTLTIPTPFRIGPVNAYLIEGEPLTLVDTGPNDPPSLVALEEQLRACGHGIEDLELVLLTHQHYDHVGLAAELRRRSGARLAAHRLLARFLERFDESMESDDTYAEAVMALHGVPAETSAFLRERSRAHRRYGAAVRVDLEHEHGDAVEAGSLRLDVALRPGHSPTDTVFVAADERVAFVGDHLIRHVSSNPVAHASLESPPDPVHRRRALAEYLDSLRATAALDVDELLPGHGEPVTDFARLVAQRIEHHERRKLRILEELRPGPATAGELIRRLWPGLPPDQVYLALSEILGHVDLLAADGAVEERRHGDGIVLHARPG